MRSETEKPYVEERRVSTNEVGGYRDRKKAGALDMTFVREVHEVITINPQRLLDGSGQ